MAKYYDFDGNEIDLTSNPLANLRCGILGDSVTEGTGASTSAKSYASLLAEKFLSLENKGIGGSCISNHWSNPMVNRYNNLASNLDVVILFGGINDFYASAPLGAEDSTTATDFNGALNTILDGWSTKYAGKRIFCVTPYQTDNGSLSSFTENSAGNTMQDYVDALKNRCAHYAVPVLNLFVESGMAGAVNTAQKSAYLADGIHPNDEGHFRIYSLILAFLGGSVGSDSSGSPVSVQPLNVSNNGTYTASAGSAYSPVTVAIPSASGVSF